MAQQIHKLAIQDAEFPLLSEQQARTVIGANSEEVYDRQTKPGLYYCHNVMPTTKGLDSVGYKQVVIPIAPVISNLSDVRIVYALNRSRLYIAWATTGQAYSLEEAEIAWTALPDTVPSTIQPGFLVENVTLGTVNGITYIWYRGVGCFIYNSVSNTLTPVTLTGLSIPAILGITASSGYLIAYTVSDIAWSSTIDATDFTPSEVTGSGGGSVAGIGGQIRFAVPNSVGILIYSETNVVAATFTGNVQYPFKIREVDDSRGGISLDLVGYEANVSSQFVFSKAGLQTITSQSAKVVLPEVTDFLAGKKFEDFSEITNLFTTTELADTMKKKLKFIASRYLVISYGVTSFTHALVYDAALQRVGKLKITHVDCFEFIKAQKEISKEAIAFLLADGSVQTLNFSVSDVSAGVAILGKFQYTRNKLLTLHRVELENSEVANPATVSSLVSLDGKTTTITPGTVRFTVEGLIQYNFRVTAVNHSLLIKGKFNLVSALLTYTVAGRR